MDRESPLRDIEPLTITEDRRRAIGDLVERVHEDEDSMGPFIQRAEQWHARRYARQERLSHAPFPGASTMWLPLSDREIGKAKASYINAQFGGHKVAIMRPANDEAVERVSDAELVFEHMVRGAGVHAMPDFEEQSSVTWDAMLTYGVGFMKAYFSYRTRLATEVIRRDALPAPLHTLSIVPSMTDEARELARQDILRRAQNDPKVSRALADQALAFGDIISPLNKAAFKEHESRIRAVVEDVFDLDPDDQMEREAIKDIMSWLRSGTSEPKITIHKNEVIEDCPRAINIPLQNLILPIHTPLDLQRAERITERVQVTAGEFEELAREEGWDEAATRKVLESGSEGRSMIDKAYGSSLTIEQLSRFDGYGYGVMDSGTLIEYWNIYHYETTEDGARELHVTSVEPGCNAILKSAPFGDHHGQMPFVAFTFEVNEPYLFSSRGVPEKLQDIESHVSGWHRHMENNMEISNTVSFAVQRNAVENFNDLRWMPGLIIPTDDPRNDIVPIQTPQTQFQVERLQAFYQQWPDQLVGGFDVEVDPGNRERVTATEFQYAGREQRRLAGMRGVLFARQLGRLYRLLWALLRQHGPRSFFVHKTGSPPRRLSQHAIRGEFDVMPFMAIGDNDPVMRDQLHQQLLAEAIQIAPMLQGDPRWRLDIGQVWHDRIQQRDPILAARLISERSEAEKQAMAEQQAAQAERMSQYREMALKAIHNAAMTPQEMALLLDEVKRNMPHGALQNIIETANAADAAARSAANA